MSIMGTTAEWNCTTCATTNRKLVPHESSSVDDRCVHCKTRHVVTASDRPIRWEARQGS